MHPRSGREVKVPNGIAHFLEHKMFESEGGGVMQEFSRMGVSANAYTDYTTTTYVISATLEFEKALSTLVRFVQNPSFTDEGIEKEKGIIEQELRMYEDMPSVRVETNLLSVLYQNHPVRFEIGGTVESIRRITREDLLTCYESFYHPSNMVLFITGEVSPQEMLDLVQEVSRKDYPESGPAKRIYPREPRRVSRKEVKERMAVSLPLVLVGYKDESRGLERTGLLKRQAAGDILLSSLFGRSSSAFARMYEKRLISERFSATFDVERTYAHAIIGGESPDPDALAGEIAGTIEDARRYGIPGEDVERLKKKALGEFVLLFNSLEYVSRLFTSTLFKGATIFDYYEALKNTKKEDLDTLLGEAFSPECSAVSVVEPGGQPRLEPEDKPE